MDPQNINYQPGSDLPRPHYEGSGGFVPQESVDSPKKAENASGDAEKPLVSQIPPPISSNLQDNQSITATGTPLSTVPTADVKTIKIPVAVDTPSSADDSDLIEQEWVEKAKNIVEQTKSDPSTQSKELSKFKADYIKKRYNKDIKVAE